MEAWNWSFLPMFVDSVVFLLHHIYTLCSSLVGTELILRNVCRMKNLQLLAQCLFLNWEIGL